MSNSSNDLFAQGISIIEQIEAQQFEAYFVGGCVRDYLLRKPITDIDLATSATPEQLQQIFPKLIPLGIEHGTVIVRENGMSFEITTFRTDVEEDSDSSPKLIKGIRSLEEDVKRRDFTINALAMDRNLTIIDHIGGKDDLEAGIIRAVKNPIKRITEDPLRIMRGIRFVSQFGFTIEPQTALAMKQSVHLLENVAIERLLSECEQIFALPHVKKAIEHLLLMKVDEHLPIFSQEKALLEAIRNSIHPLQSYSEVIAVMHLLAPRYSVKTWSNEWKCSKQIEKDASALIRAYTQMVTNEGIQPTMVYHLQGRIDSFVRVVNVISVDKQISHSLYDVEDTLPIRTRNELAVNGYDLLQLFPEKKQGKWINDLIETIEYNVVMSKLPNEKERIEEWIMCNQQDFN